MLGSAIVSDAMRSLVSLDRGTMRDRNAKEKRRQVCTCRRFF
jgi:hypothetical protein